MSKKFFLSLLLILCVGSVAAADPDGSVIDAVETVIEFDSNTGKEGVCDIGKSEERAAVVEYLKLNKEFCDSLKNELRAALDKCEDKNITEQEAKREIISPALEVATAPFFAKLNQQAFFAVLCKIPFEVRAEIDQTVGFDFYVNLARYLEKPYSIEECVNGSIAFIDPLLSRIAGILQKYNLVNSEALVVLGIK